jgi:hypothetical protein
VHTGAVRTEIFVQGDDIFTHNFVDWAQVVLEKPTANKIIYDNDKDGLSRILKHRDVTGISVTSIDGSSQDFYVPWSSKNEFSNSWMRVLDKEYSVILEWERHTGPLSWIMERVYRARDRACIVVKRAHWKYHVNQVIKYQHNES